MKHRETVVKKIVKMQISISLPEEQDHNCAHIIFILVKSERCLYSCWSHLVHFFLLREIPKSV